MIKLAVILSITINVYLSRFYLIADVKQNNFRLQFSPYGYIMFSRKIIIKEEEE